MHPDKDIANGPRFTVLRRGAHKRLIALNASPVPAEDVEVDVARAAANMLKVSR